MAEFRKSPTKMGYMIVTNTSEWSGITRHVEMLISPAELKKYKMGVAINDAFPRLNPNERMFIQSGITPKEWEEMWKIGDEANDDDEEEKRSA